ncbi:MAG: 50S ribosomal protein L29 [Elusimicrobia bacterium GWA2_62_23]|jgi:large subunit ribosomal protein L29|nr:MAG: 50S ribosomal protein L29 [Elusimicrobia bacterium GWA2_62_23]OGR67848.1 MAG: 50S ribosomal protein L29 [Elusimicrobia bacterium GWC2_63_65]
MKSKDRETLRNMGDAELKAQVADLKKQLFQIKFKRTTAPVENPLVLRTARRKIAMINTWLRQRELAKSKTAEAKK